MIPALKDDLEDKTSVRSDCRGSGDSKRTSNVQPGRGRIAAPTAWRELLLMEEQSKLFLETEHSW